MDSHLSSAVYTYDCMHKYACKELHTYTTLRVHIYIQITTHIRAQITPVNRVYNTYSNIHKHALRCGPNCIFKLVTQQITYLH